MTCAELEKKGICNCRGCSKCRNDCSQKCSMRDTNIKGSYNCATWYKMDPKYTAEFLIDHAVVTGAEDKKCTCDGCSGTEAASYCPNDTPYHPSDNRSRYMDIDTAKTLGKIGRMRLTINDDMVDPEKCRKNDFCKKHTCLEVHCLLCLCVLGRYSFCLPENRGRWQNFIPASTTNANSEGSYTVVRAMPVYATQLPLSKNYGRHRCVSIFDNCPL